MKRPWPLLPLALLGHALGAVALSTSRFLGTAPPVITEPAAAEDSFIEDGGLPPALQYNEDTAWAAGSSQVSLAANEGLVNAEHAAYVAGLEGDEDPMLPALTFTDDQLNRSMSRLKEAVNNSKAELQRLRQSLSGWDAPLEVLDASAANDTKTVLANRELLKHLNKTMSANASGEETSKFEVRLEKVNETVARIQKSYGGNKTGLGNLSVRLDKLDLALFGPGLEDTQKMVVNLTSTENMFQRMGENLTDYLIRDARQAAFWNMSTMADKKANATVEVLRKLAAS